MDLIRTSQLVASDLYIFDTARAARDVAFAVTLQKFFDHHRIRVHYAANGMVSGGPGFKIQHTFMALMDEQFSINLGHNVKRGHIDQHEKGYFASARTYGYDHVEDVDPAYADSFDRRHRKGVRLAVNPTQAEVIRTIYGMYRSGKGYSAISKHLNESGIKSPRRPTKHGHRLWGTSSIRTIIHNDRYTGIVRYGRVESRRDPESSKVKHIERPKSDWRTYHSEALRIIEDEEFQAVQKIRLSRDTLGAQRKAAGLNKAGGVFPWSGLLRCGDCGGAMNILQPDTYMCSTAVRGGGCKNKLKLMRSSFQEHMLEMLVQALRRARSFDAMLDSIMEEVERQQFEAKRTAETEATNRGSAEAKLADVVHEITNLVLALGRNPDSDAIENRLRELEADKKVLTVRLQGRTANVEVPVARVDVAEWLSRTMENMEGLLSTDLHTYRDEIRKRVDHLILTPTMLEGSQAYRITGDLRLFEDRHVKMLSCNVHLSWSNSMLAAEDCCSRDES